jgi:hypothetical protein
MKSWPPPTPSKVRRRRAIAITIPVALCGLAVATAARAQVSLSATLESAYRFRGVALTDDRPDLKLGLAYDHRSGLYGGGAVIVGDQADGGFTPIGYTAHLGFARRTASGLTWDVGVANARVVGDRPVQTPYFIQGFRYVRTDLAHYKADYAEVYAGAAKGPFSAHLYLSPDYLSQGVSTAYLDLNGVARPVPRLRVFGHAGVLVPLGGGGGPGGRDARLDLRSGVALELGHVELQAAWTTVTPRADYPAGYRQNRDALVVSVSAFF